MKKKEKILMIALTEASNWENNLTRQERTEMTLFEAQQQKVREVFLKYSKELGAGTFSHSPSIEPIVKEYKKKSYPKTFEGCKELILDIANEESFRDKVEWVRKMDDGSLLIHCFNQMSMLQTRLNLNGRLQKRRMEDLVLIKLNKGQQLLILDSSVELVRKTAESIKDLLKDKKWWKGKPKKVRFNTAGGWIKIECSTALEARTLRMELAARYHSAFHSPYPISGSQMIKQVILKRR